MRFRCERDSLVEAFGTAARAAATRGAAAVLSGLLLRLEGNRLLVTGTDLNLTIQVDLEVVGLEDGSCVVPSKLATDIARSLEPGAVTVDGREDKVEISAARSNFGLRAFPVVEFPAVSFPEGPITTFPAAVLLEGLRQVVRAASSDDARPLLTGVLLTSQGDGLRLVATDSYRLALRDLAGSSGPGEGGDILVPARSLAELQRLTPAPGDGEEQTMVAVSTGPHEARFTLGHVRISTRLLDGTYPDYRQLIPDEYPNRLHLGKESLLAALRRVRLLVKDNTTPVRLSMRQGGVDLSVTSQEDGDASEAVDGDFSGEDLVIAFNPSYLIEGVEAVLSDEVLLETAEPSRPATVRAADDEQYRYLLMPVRVLVGRVLLRHLEVVDFRCFAVAELDPAPEGLTVLTGANGTGKTSLLEAVAFLGTRRSFRGGTADVLVRAGADQAVLRGELEERAAQTPVLVEMSISQTGRDRAQVNRQQVRSRHDLAMAVPTTVFSPDDLAIVQGGPSLRRDLLDGALDLLDAEGARYADQVERVLRQRNALLRQAPRDPGSDVLATLDVWDERLSVAGDGLRAHRLALVERLQPVADQAYASLLDAGVGERSGPFPSPADHLTMALRSNWDGALLDALGAARHEDLRRAVTTIGPHRDDMGLRLAGRDARQQASQGEQRCVVLALRLAVHRLVTEERGHPPTLLLDDVFSELDPSRTRALVERLPAGQALLTTALPVPPELQVASVVDVTRLAARAAAS